MYAQRRVSSFAELLVHQYRFPLACSVPVWYGVIHYRKYHNVVLKAEIAPLSQGYPGPSPNAVRRF